MTDAATVPRRLQSVIRHVTGRPGWSVTWMDGVISGPDVRYSGSHGRGAIDILVSDGKFDATVYFGAHGEGGRDARYYITTPAQAARWVEKKLGASSTPFETRHLHYVDGAWRAVPATATEATEK
jgi:hypothetical protein